VTTPKANWLQTYLAEVLPTCTKTTCTTCGATRFRQGLLSVAWQATGRSGRPKWDHAVAIEIGRMLTTVSHDGTNAHSARLFAEAINLILFELSAHASEAFYSEIEPGLAGTWAGGVRDHIRAVDASRADYQRSHDPETIRQQREDKRRQRQARHVERIAFYKWFGSAWRPSQPEDGTRQLLDRSGRK
jgi:hypothetical protein